jgi:hypothetical protein
MLCAQTVSIRYPFQVDRICFTFVKYFPLHLSNTQLHPPGKGLALPPMRLRSCPGAPNHSYSLIFLKHTPMPEKFGRKRKGRLRWSFRLSITSREREFSPGATQLLHDSPDHKPCESAEASQIKAIRPLPLTLFRPYAGCKLFQRNANPELFKIHWNINRLFVVREILIRRARKCVSKIIM